MTKQRAFGWKQWTEVEARSALRRWKASGKALTVYARESGVSANRLRWWKQRLEEWREDTAARVQLVPVVARVEPSRVAMPLTVRLPGGATAELEPSAETAAWVAALALHLAGAR